MVHIECDEPGAQVLRRALDDYVSELRMQVANTDSQDFRDDLKNRERILRGVIDQLARGSSTSNQ